MIIRGRVTTIEKTTTKIAHFAHDSKCDTANVVKVMDDTDEEISGPSRVTFAPTQRSILKKTAPHSTPFLKKIAPREVQISHHEFDGLKQTTKDQILFVYDRTMGPNTPLDRGAFDSHSRICQALRFLGVGIFEYDKNSLTTPENLLANLVHEWNKLLFDRYEADPDTTKSLKEQASRRCWGLDELKAITARWMQGKDEDKLLEPGRKLMKIDDETRSKYQTSLNGYDTLQQATKDFIAEAWSKSSGRISTYCKVLQSLSFLSVDHKDRDTLLVDWMRERDPQLDSENLQPKVIKHTWSLATLKSIMEKWMQGKNQEALVARRKRSIEIEENRLKDRPEEKAQKLRERQKHIADEKKTRLEEIRGREMQNEEEETVEEVIREGLVQDEVRCNTRSKMKLDAETLKMIKGVKEAHDALTRRTARLLAHIVDVPDFTDSPRLPRNRRLEAPQPIDYPWMNTKKR